MYSVATRNLTADERMRLKGQLHVSADDIAWAAAPFFGLALTGYGVGKLVHWIVSKFGYETGSGLTYLLTGVLSSLGLVGSILWCRGLVRHRRDLRAKMRENAVEEIHVEGASAVRIGSADDEVPILVFDIGEGKLLCLIGQWMWDPSLFEPRAATRTFPSDSFSVSCLPESGAVLKVRVSGKHLPRLREATLKDVGLANRRIEDFRECVILEGTLPQQAGHPGE
jgi:hypothetical protein